MTDSKRASEHAVKDVSKELDELAKEMGKVFFGQDYVVKSLIRALLCDSHALVEGVPGIAKTLAVKALAKASGCTSKRIQFTVDLLPTDILGLTTYEPKKGFEIVKGPIFANFVIADEINRAPPKTQSALLEAMQEKQVTIGKETFSLPKPFFVMATQNPIEHEGVYSLPEAQIDRFIFKIVFSYPQEEDEEKIMATNVTFQKFEDVKLKEILSPKKIIKIQGIAHDIYLDKKIREYILKIVKTTRDKNFRYAEYITLGSSPRASVYLFIAAKAEALMQGRNYVIPKDVDTVAHDVLRHRMILSYRAQAEGIDTDKIISEILKLVKVR
jgi:MoxR-like ATPase